MASDVWKEYEENMLTHSAAHYLMTIHELHQGQGYARVTDIAKRMNITRGSCSISLKPLKRRGLVVEDENKFLSLSEEGLQLALMVERNDELLEILFRDILGVSPEKAEIDACKIEHLLSIETSIKLRDFIELVESDKEEVKAFRRLISKELPICTHETEKCAYCSDQCYYEKQHADS